MVYLILSFQTATRSLQAISRRTIQTCQSISQHEHQISPTDGWANGTCEPMSRNFSPVLCQRLSIKMARLVEPHGVLVQYLFSLSYWLFSIWGIVWLHSKKFGYLSFLTSPNPWPQHLDWRQEDHVCSLATTLASCSTKDETSSWQTQTRAHFPSGWFSVSQVAAACAIIFSAKSQPEIILQILRTIQDLEQDWFSCLQIGASSICFYPPCFSCLTIEEGSSPKTSGTGFNPKY